MLHDVICSWKNGEGEGGGEEGGEDEEGWGGEMHDWSTFELGNGCWGQGRNLLVVRVIPEGKRVLRFKFGRGDKIRG